MENKLEQLLNALIQRGWKPFGKANRWYVSIDRTIHTKSPFFDFENHNMSVSTRELIAKESWLWQFVCENGMIKKEHKHERILDPTFWEWWADCKRQEHDWNYWYRLIESSLKDESELEDFLLQNIKVWND